MNGKLIAFPLTGFGPFLASSSLRAIKEVSNQTLFIPLHRSQLRMVPPEEEHAVSPPPHPPVDVQPAADLPEAAPQETQADPSLELVETKEAAEPPPEPPELPEAPQPPQPPQSPPAADPVPAEVAEPLSPSAGAAAPPLQLPATHFDLLPPPPPPGGNSPGDYVLPPAFPSPGGEQGQLTEQQQQWQQHWQAMGPQGGEIAPTEQWGAMDYYVDANGYAAEPEFDHNAARQKITQYRKEAAARRRRQMRIAEKKSVAMRAELDKESEVRARHSQPEPEPLTLTLTRTLTLAQNLNLTPIPTLPQAPILARTLARALARARTR